MAWLGEVPVHWEVRRLKFVASYHNSNVDKKSYAGQKNVRLCNYTDVYYNEKITNNMDFMMATATDSEIKSMRLKEGDVVVTKDSEDPADIGVPALVSEPLDNVVCGYHLTILRAKVPDVAWYLHRAIQSHPTRGHFFVESPGITRFGLNQDAIGDLVISVPPISERKCIADYINHQTTQIDQLIEKKTRFIKLLKEKRAALITEAVTGKFDVRTGKPYAEYKDSGVAWLGEVPEHWGVRRLKYVAPLRNIKILAGESDLSYIGLENIESWSGRYVVQDESNDSEGLSSRFFSSDVLFGKLRPYLAKAFLSNFEGICSSEFLVLQVKGIQSHFLVRFVLSVGFIKEVDSSTYGAKMPRASWEFIGNLPVTLPPTEEQSTIATLLDKETTQIDQLIEKTKQSINLLKEKRAALITAAVTGKIDVRDFNPKR